MGFPLITEEQIAEKLRKIKESIEKLNTPYHFPTNWYGEDDLENVPDDVGSDERDYPGPERKQYFCEHEWVNVSFTGIKMVCKLCNKEKP